MSLRSIFEGLTLPSVKWSHYLGIYEKHLGHLVGKEPSVIEIGVAGGGSLEMWQKYFGAGTKVIGIDKRAECKFPVGAHLHVGLQGNRRWLTSLCPDALDVVVDDGSHFYDDQVASFETLWPKLSERGVYVVEDLHVIMTRNRAEWRGSGPSRGFLDYANNMVDYLQGKRSLAHAFCHGLRAVHFYAMAVVFEKGPEEAHEPITVKP